jgi:hypothetical protein
MLQDLRFFFFFFFLENKRSQIWSLSDVVRVSTWNSG